MIMMKLFSNRPDRRAEVEDLRRRLLDLRTWIVGLRAQAAAKDDMISKLRQRNAKLEGLVRAKLEEQMSAQADMIRKQRASIKAYNEI